MTPRLYPAAILAGMLAGCFLLGLLAVGMQVLAGVDQAAATCGGSPATDGAPISSTAQREIPARLIPVYRQAAAAFGLGADGWAWLAAVNRIETDFGRDLSTSSAGAVGWMQFEPDTWRQYGVDGNGDGRKDPYDPADAIDAAARYLRSLGAPGDWQAAIRGYNGGPGNVRSPVTLGYWQSAVTYATAYLGGAPTPAAPAAPAAFGVSSPAAGAAAPAPATPAAPCQPCPAPDPAQAPDTLVAYDPAGVPDAHGGRGFTAGPGTVYTVGQEPQIAQRLDALGRALHLRLIGISGYRTPAHSLAVGGFAEDPHTRGAASDTPGTETIPESTLERFGLTRPFPGAAEADHIQLLGTAAAGAATAAALPSDQCSGAGAVPLAPGDRAQIEPDGRAAAPASAPPAVRAMIAAGNQLIGKPYVYGGGHADFGLAAGYDCSSSVSWALHGAGYLTAPEDSTTLEGFGRPGAGLWVTIYADPGHTFVYVAGIRLDTSPQAGDGHYTQPGPRWRPASRSTAGFVVRHPPGL